MYGGGMGMGMGGRQQMESEFFAPKMSEQEQLASQQGGRISELGELNTSVLDSLHSWSNAIYSLARRLLLGLARLHAALRTGAISPATARRAAAVALAAASLCMAGAVRSAARRRQRRLLMEAVFARNRVVAPMVVPLPLPGFWGGLRAAL